MEEEAKRDKKNKPKGDARQAINEKGDKLLARAESKREKDRERLNNYETRRTLRQAIRKFILGTSFQDKILAETVCTTNRKEILDKVFPSNVEVTIGDIPDVEKGEVLLDNRARGTFQR